MSEKINQIGSEDYTKNYIGYPYFCDLNKVNQNDNVNQNDAFLIFSLSRVLEDSELNLAHASSLPILLDLKSSQFNLGDEFGYLLCDQISSVCGKIELIPQTQTLILDYDGFCHLVSQSEVIVSNIASELGVTKMSAMEQAQNFFQDKTVIVQAAGAQGVIYKFGLYLQSAGSAGLITRTVTMAKLAGVNGFRILQAQPALAIAIPTTGAIFFYGCGAIAGNNTIGKAFVTTGNILALPMKGVELMWNSYGNPVIQKVFGIPVILNMTQSFQIGQGYTIEEIRKYVPLNATSLTQFIKNKIIKWLS